ncbi:hypothetical protein K7432_003229 [Basidiobolus ranarum]|uniref:Uncharacterized protein n=1 Tax=Basidiobolus ranarum TaxID=34480 RepID=A0ABR2X0B0_9FUNG
MRYGYLEGKSGQGYFSKIVTPPHLTKIGLSPNHDTFGFTGLRKSILNWMESHKDLRIELQCGSNQGFSERRSITFELTSLYKFNYSPSTCIIRPTKNEDYSSPIPGSPEYFNNSRKLVTHSGKTLGELLPIIRLCWKADSRVRFILNQTESTSRRVANSIPPNSLAFSLTLETCPTYKSMDSVTNSIRRRELPAYSSSDNHRISSDI